MESAAGGSGNSSSLRTLMFNDKIDTPNLGDFLRVKENNNNITAGLTLGAVLSNKPECSSSSSSSPVHSSNRTLLDIIQEDPNSSRKTRKTWKHFRNKLRLKRAADTWTSNITTQQGNSNQMIMSRRLSPRSPPPVDDVTYPEDLPVEIFGQPGISASGSRRLLRRNSSRNATAEEEEESEGENAGGDEPVRMSLMALLAENDGDGSAYMIGDGDEEDEDDEEEVDDNGVSGTGTGSGVGAVGEYNNCCVCMVRHKGAAFIPCGHTFCRLCCRELWVQRGNCPLCNNFIVEVLDIF